MSGSSLFNIPAKKMFITDLCFCKELPGQSQDGSPTAQLKTWESVCSGIHVPFRVVTVQGLITQVNPTDDSLHLDDGTSVALVKGYNKVPFCSIKPKSGQYVMIVGQLQKSGSLPVIRTIKIQDLTGHLALSAVWPLEVIDELAHVG